MPSQRAKIYPGVANSTKMRHNTEHSERTPKDRLIYQAIIENGKIKSKGYVPYNHDKRFKYTQRVSRSRAGSKKDHIIHVSERSNKSHSTYKYKRMLLSYLALTNLNTNQVPDNFKNDISMKLDELFSEFPFEIFQELSLIRFEWDNATRLVLNYAPDDIKLKLIRNLRDEFWSIYTKRMKIYSKMDLPKNLIREWGIDYNNELNEVEKRITDVRDEILLNHYKPSDRSRKLAQAFMQSRKFIIE